MIQDILYYSISVTYAPSTETAVPYMLTQLFSKQTSHIRLLFFSNGHNYALLTWLLHRLLKFTKHTENHPLNYTMQNIFPHSLFLIAELTYIRTEHLFLTIHLLDRSC